MIKLKIKRGKETPVIHKHHWIFSGAVERIPEFESGEIAEIYSFRDDLLGHAFLNNGTTILGRMINFSKSDPFDSIRYNIQRAAEMRKSLFDEEKTNTYRVVNGEGDFLSGLIVDRYNDVLVIQIVASGFNKNKQVVVDELVKIFNPKCIYEKSTSPARVKEGLESIEAELYGSMPDKVIVKEYGVTFDVDIKTGQKTGLFLDQREMRKLIGEISFNKNVLNCFSYTGGFSLYSALNGAKSVTSVDSAADAVEISKKNFELNKLGVNEHKFIATDAFKFLNEDKLDYDIVILDPPAFAKKKQDIPNARKGYLNLNRSALSKMKPGTFLLTCSCSYHIDRYLFESIINRAANETGRTIKVISRQILAKDHPINPFHDENDYLKSLLLYVE